MAAYASGTPSVLPTDSWDHFHRDVFTALPSAYLVLDSDLVIVEANEAYLTLLDRRREDLVGRQAFEAFPPTADTLEADGRNPVETSFLRARDSGRPDVLPLQRYDVLDPISGLLQERYWSLTNTALRGSDGRTRWIVQRVEDVSDYVRELSGERTHLHVVQDELLARSRDVEVARRAESVAAGRLAALGELAHHLARASNVAQLTSVLHEHGGPALGAGTASVRVRVGEDSDVRAPVRDSEHVLVDDGRVLGVLAIDWSEEPGRHSADPEVVTAVATVTAQCAQALGRIKAREAEQSAAAEAVRMSEALQRSLLSQPAQPPGLTVAAAYRPASERAQIGGDWYDCFVAGGRPLLVVGDVSGHDREAAAEMGQVRNVLRGIASAVAESPAALLRRLDRTLQSLAVPALATVLVLALDQSEEQAGSGERTARWSNAGHPPPVIIHPDKHAELLISDAELMLGVDADAVRSDYERVLPAGSTLLLFTDGLVERRGASIEDGLAWLVATAGALASRGSADLCADLLDLVAGHAEDDVVVLSVHLPVAATSTCRLPPTASAAGQARRFVAERLAAAGLRGRVAEAELAVTELVTNVVLHARTEMSVEVDLTEGGANITVHDGDPRPPLTDLASFSLSDSAGTGNLSNVMISGRGLGLVAALSAAWGFHLSPAGKDIWFRVEADGAPAPTEKVPETAADLVERWAAFDASNDLDDDQRVVDVTIPLELPVQALLSAKTRVEDLIRDLRLVLLQVDNATVNQTVDEEELVVARRLDSAVRDFADGRRQLRSQILRAAAEGREELRLTVHLPASAADAALRYGEALDAADELSRHGKLLLAGTLHEHSALRHLYLDEIVHGLRTR